MLTVELMGFRRRRAGMRQPLAARPCCTAISCGLGVLLGLGACAAPEGNIASPNRAPSSAGPAASGPVLEPTRPAGSPGAGGFDDFGPGAGDGLSSGGSTSSG